MEFGHPSDDAVSGITEGAERRADCQDEAQSKDWPKNRGAHG